MGDKASLDRWGQQHEYHGRVDQEQPKTQVFRKAEKIIKNTKTQKRLEIWNISDIPFDQRSLIHREAWFSTCFVRQNQRGKKLFFARRFQTTSKQKCSNLRPLLSITILQGIRIYKIFGHPTSGSGGKKTFKRYHKSEQTDRHTDKQTYRKHQPRGPML